MYRSSNLNSLVKLILSTNNKLKVSFEETLLEKLVSLLFANKSYYIFIKNKIDFKSYYKLEQELKEIEKKEEENLKRRDVNLNIIVESVIERLIYHYNQTFSNEISFSQLNIYVIRKTLRDAYEDDLGMYVETLFLENTALFLNLSLIKYYGILSYSEINTLNKIEELLDSIIIKIFDEPDISIKSVSELFDRYDIDYESSLKNLFYVNSKKSNFNVIYNIVSNKIFLQSSERALLFKDLKTITREFNSKAEYLLPNKPTDEFFFSFPIIEFTSNKSSHIVSFIHAPFSLKYEKNKDYIKTLVNFINTYALNSASITENTGFTVILFDNYGTINAVTPKFVSKLNITDLIKRKEINIEKPEEVEFLTSLL